MSFRVFPWPKPAPPKPRNGIASIAKWSVAGVGLLICLTACSKIEPLSATAVQTDFEKAARNIVPSLTPEQARALIWLEESSPGQFDGQLGQVLIQCTFEGDELALGRVGVEGHRIGESLRSLLENLHGEPEIITDGWQDPAVPDGPRRDEIKWAYPHGIDLVEHGAYVPGEGEDPERAMPSGTTLRLDSAR